MSGTSRGDASGLASQHDQLNRFIEEVGRALALGDRLHAGDVLRWLQSALAAHFTVEEEIVFVAVAGIEPDLEEVFAVLTREHGRFLLQVTQIDRVIEAGDSVIARRMVDGFLADLRRHEEREEAILGGRH